MSEINNCPVCKGSMVQVVNDEGYPAGSYCYDCGTVNTRNLHEYDFEACPCCGSHLLYQESGSNDVLVCLQCRRRYCAEEFEVTEEMYSDDGPSSPSSHTFTRRKLVPIDRAQARVDE
jgi:uncharacterized protein YbaR (Trm112 family)